MSREEKKIEKPATHTGENVTVGKPITDEKDNKHHEREQAKLMVKALRFTKDESNAFKIDMGNGAEIMDSRPITNTNFALDNALRSLPDSNDTHKTENHKTENYKTENHKSEDQIKQVTLQDWLQHGGDTLARMVAERTQGGGLMLLGPEDTMRANAEKYKDPDGYFPIFTHASGHDLHMYYGLHQGKKAYSAEVLAELIRKTVPEGQPIRLLGCESGIDEGIAMELAKLLPEYKIYAPNGYCELKDGKATVYKKKPSEMPWGEDPPKGKFVLVKPEEDKKDRLI
jgi:hypothetical protein